MNPFEQKESLPNAQNAMTLGIISICSSVLLACCCYGIGALVGVILGVIALVFSSQALKMYAESPEKYLQKDHTAAKTGKTLGIIGVVVGGLMLLIILVLIIVNGLDFMDARKFRSRGF